MVALAKMGLWGAPTADATLSTQDGETSPQMAGATFAAYFRGIIQLFL